MQMHLDLAFWGRSMIYSRQFTKFTTTTTWRTVWKEARMDARRPIRRLLKKIQVRSDRGLNKGSDSRNNEEGI